MSAQRFNELTQPARHRSHVLSDEQRAEVQRRQRLARQLQSVEGAVGSTDRHLGRRVLSEPTELSVYFDAEIGVLAARVEDDDHPLRPGDFLLRIGSQTPDAGHAVDLFAGYEADELIPVWIIRRGDSIKMELVGVEKR